MEDIVDVTPVTGEAAIMKLQANGTHLASLSLYQVDDQVWGAMRLADGEFELIEVPPHMAGQLPMALAMMKQMSHG
jgi:hypothetical protein